MTNYSAKAFDLLMRTIIVAFNKKSNLSVLSSKDFQFIESHGILVATFKNHNFLLHDLQLIFN